MLRKLGRGLSLKSGGKSASKFKFDVQIDKLENLPGPVKKCRVVWSRGPKLQMTEIKEVKSGTAVYKQTLSQVATMYKDAKDAYEAKEYNFKVQVPGKGGDDKMITVGKADVDLSKFVMFEGKAQPKMIPIMFKVGATTTGYLKVVVTAELLQANVDDDGMTEVSGMTGLTSSMDMVEQDLSGFEEEVVAKAPAPAALPARLSGGATQSASRFADKAKEAGKPAEAAASIAVSSLGTKRPPVQAAKAKDSDDEDGDVSPMDLSPEPSFTEPAPAAKSASKPRAAAGRARPAAVDSDDDDSMGPSSSGGGAKRASVKAPEKTEAELRAELFGVTTKAAAAPAKPNAVSSAAKAPAKPAAPVPAAPTASAAEAAAAAKRSSLFDRPQRQDKTPSRSVEETREPQPESPRPSAAASATSAKVAASKQASAAIAAAVASSSGSDELRVENERLRQQLAAFKELGSSAEEVRRQTKRKEEGLLAERDDYQQQVAELQERLKEAVVGMVTPEEQAEAEAQLRSQLAEAQQAVAHAHEAAAAAEAAHAQQLAEVTRQAAAGGTSAQQRADLERRLSDALRQVDETVLMATKSEREKRELRDKVSKLSAEVTELSDKLQQVGTVNTQLQAAAAAAAAVAASVPTGRHSKEPSLSTQVQELRAQTAMLQHNADSMEQQRDSILANLAEEVYRCSQLPVVLRHLDNSLALEVEEVVDAMTLDASSRESYKELLMDLRAIFAAMDQLLNNEQALQNRLNLLQISLEAASSEAGGSARAQQAALKRENADLAGRLADTEAQLQDLQAAASRLHALERKAGAQSSDAFESGDGHDYIRAVVLHSNAEQALSASGVPTNAKLNGQMQQLKAALKSSEKECDVLREAVAAQDAEMRQLKQDLRAQQEASASSRSEGQPGTGKESVERDLRKAQRKIQELLRLNAKLEGIAAEIDEQAAADRAALQEQLQAADARYAALCSNTEQLEAQVMAAMQQVQHQQQQHQHRQAAMSAAGSPNNMAMSSNRDSQVNRREVDALQEKLSAAEAAKRALESERSALLKRLAEEQEEKTELEEQLRQQLEEGGDDVAQETVAAYEAKYNRLKSRYRELQEGSREEVDALHDELHEAREHIAHLEHMTAQLEAFRTQADQGQAVLVETMQHNNKIGTDLAELQQENESLMHKLVQTKLELAQLSEREIISRREVYKSKETNMRLASKMTKLETLIYTKKN